MKITERIDAKTHIPKECLCLKPPIPKSVKIEITSRCNYNCEYCGVKDSKREKKDIDSGLMRELIFECCLNDIQEIGFFLLGEPLLNPKLCDYISYAKSLEMRTFVTTNGSLCDVKMFSRLQEAGLDSLKFSINAMSPLEYEKVHGVDNLDKVCNYLMDCNEIATTTKLSVSTIWNKEHENEMWAFDEMLELVGIEQYYLPLYNQGGHTKGKLYGNIGRLDNPVKPDPCWNLFTQAHINVDGCMTACCFDHTGDFIVGDLNKVSFEEAWHSDKFQKLREQHLNGELSDSLCAKCLGIK